MKEVLETVVETPYESYEQCLSRRTSTMSGIIGMMSARLEILDMHMKIDVEHYSKSKDLKQVLGEYRKGILETLIRYQNEWAEMQDYKEGDYMKESSDKKIAEYTTELEALKTLAL